MKQKLVIIVGRYYPSTSAVGQCAKKLVDEMKKEYEVTIICTSDTIHKQSIFKENDVEIHIVTTPYLKLLNKCNTTSGLIGYFYRIKQLFIRLIMIIGQPHTNYMQLIKAYQNVLTTILDIDIIIPFCMPMEGVIAALNFSKNTNSKVFPVIFDSIATSPTLKKTKLLKKQQYLDNIEDFIFKQAEHIFVCSHLTDHINNTWQKYLDKITFIEHPLITNEISTAKEVKKFILYAGSVVSECIEIDDFIDIYALLNSKNKYPLYIYSNIKQENIKYGNLPIFVNEWLDAEKYNNAIDQCYAMISMSTKNTKQFASKIFNAISHGKPIILVYYEESHPNVSILKKYPLALLLNYNDDLQVNAEKLDKWLEIIGNTECNYHLIEKTYNEFTPKYIYHQIKKYL